MNGIVSRIHSQLSSRMLSLILSSPQIHNCSHPNDGDAHFRISETDMFLAIFTYIEHIFTKIKPQKLFFLAVDGVAPRAKMNQQRSRRFRTAKEARDIKLKAERRGEELPEEEAFDSNCITPGTPFMARLSLQLKYFLARKVTEDSQWQGVEIVLSGHEVPGEGEHKIMEYIRLAKAQPGYNQNVRHCLYGLDADLIMLGLLSHDPHFALLREEVNFGPSRKKKGGLESQNFFLLHLSLFREYLDIEFQELRSTLPFAYSLERVIDDFILLNIFVGNDFLPHLPGLHIHEGALGRLFQIYKRVLPKAGGYINEDGNLHTARLAMILSELSQFEQEHFEQEFADASWYKGKQEKAKKKAKVTPKMKANFALTPSQRIMFEKVKAFIQDQQLAPSRSPREVFLGSTSSTSDRTFLQDLARDLGLEVSFDEYDPEEDAPAISISTSSALDAMGEEEESKAAIKRVLAKYDKAKTVEGTEGSSDEEDEMNQRMKDKIVQWKKTYYREKMGLDYDSQEDMSTLAFR
jgi:5'-3' exoribonuclease 1